MVAHSTFGASSAKRLIACPASFWLAAQAPPQAASVWAAAGTAAHAIAEECLRTGDACNPQDFVGATMVIENRDVPIDQGDADAIEVFTDYVRGLQSLGYEIALEVRVSPNWLWTKAQLAPPVDMFGTADCVAYHADLCHLVIVDYKHGAGVPVEVEDNEQLLYYGVGAVAELGRLFPGFDFNQPPPSAMTVETVIIQPRAAHADGPVRKAVLTLGELLTWGFNTLKPAVHEALRPGAPIRSGDHCRWCPARVGCPELARVAQHSAKHIFDDDTGPARPDLAKYDSQALGALLDNLDALLSWAEAVKAHAHERIEQGEKVPGWKVVAKRAVRKWTDEFMVDKMLDAWSVPEHEYIERKVRSPAQVLKLPIVKRNPDFQSELGSYITAQSSGTTLVRADDKRAAAPGRPAARDAFDD